MNIKKALKKTSPFPLRLYFRAGICCRAQLSGTWLKPLQHWNLAWWSNEIIIDCHIYFINNWVSHRLAITEIKQMIFLKNVKLLWCNKWNWHLCLMNWVSLKSLALVFLIVKFAAKSSYFERNFKVFKCNCLDAFSRWGSDIS